MTLEKTKHWQQNVMKKTVLTLAVAVFLGIIPVITYFFLSINPVLQFVLSIFLLALGANLVVSMTRSFGQGSLFSIFFAIVTINILDTGTLGWEKIIAYLMAGLMLEMMYSLLKLKIDVLSLDLVVGTSIAMALLPLFTAFIISTPIATKFPLALINVVLLSFAVGLGTSVLFSLCWHHVEKNKKAARFLIKWRLL